MSLKKLWTKLFAKSTPIPKNPFENLEIPKNKEDLPLDFLYKWVTPFYMGALSMPDDSQIIPFATAANEIDISIVKALLGDRGWRSRLTGAYFAAINNYNELEDTIGKHLVKSEVCYAGRGYCVALAAFGSNKSKDYLIAYLNYYLERPDLFYDQGDAFCALDYLDKNKADKLLGKWNTFVAVGRDHWNLENWRAGFSNSMLTLDKIRREK